MGRFLSQETVIKLMEQKERMGVEGGEAGGQRGTASPSNLLCETHRLHVCDVPSCSAPSLHRSLLFHVSVILFCPTRFCPLLFNQDN